MWLGGSTLRRTVNCGADGFFHRRSLISGKRCCVDQGINYSILVLYSVSSSEARRPSYQASMANPARKTSPSIDPTTLHFTTQKPHSTHSINLFLGIQLLQSLRRRPRLWRRRLSFKRRNVQRRGQVQRHRCRDSEPVATPRRRSCFGAG